MGRLLATLLGLAATLVGLLAAAVVVIALLYDWNDLRPVIEQQAEAATGRKLEITGDLNVDLGPTTTLRAQGVRLANPDWAEPQTMAEIGTVEVAIDLVDTIFGDRIDLPRVLVDRAEVGLIRTAEGRANWQLGDAQDQPNSGGSTLPEIGHLEIRHSTISLRDALNGRNGEGRIDTLTAEAGSGDRGELLEIDGQGAVAGEPVRLAGSVGALGRLDADAPYPLDLTLSSAQTRVSAKGTIERPLSPKALDLRVSAEVPEPAQALAEFGLPKVLGAPLDLEARIQHQGQTWTIGELGGLLGEEKLQGRASIDLSADPPEVQADLDWNAFKPIIEAAAQTALAREFKIGGDLEVAFGEPTRVTARMMNLANPDWAEDRWMAQVDRLTVAFDLWQAIEGTYQIPRIEVEGPNVRLVRDAEGRTNWSFGSGASSGSEQGGPAPRTEIPAIDRLLISGGTLRFQDAISDVDFEGSLGTIEVEDDQGRVRDDFELEGQGKLVGQPLDLQVEAGGLQILRDADAPYPLDLKITLAETMLEAKGTIDQPLAFKGFDMNFGVEGPNPGPLLARFDLPGLNTPPYTLRGHLSRKEGLWRLSKAHGTVGDSDVEGTISLHPDQEPPLVRADLTSENFDLDDVGGLIGLPPSDAPGETLSDAQIEQARAFKKRKRVLPDARFDPEAWQNINFDGRFVGKSVQARNVPLDRVRIEARLEDGLLALDPVQTNVAGGKATLFATIDSTRDPPFTDLDLRFEGMSLQRFMPDSDVTGETSGQLAGRAKLTSTGRSVEEIATAANGRLGLTMAGGQINSILLEAISLDLAEAIAVMMGDEGGDTETSIRCLVADFELENGVAASKAFVLDTTDMKITGAGKIDLGAETLDLVLSPQAKDTSLLAATTPIHIEGTLGDPSITPEASDLLAKGAAALGLGVVLPVVGAIIPFIDTGVAEDSPCASLIAEAKEAADAE